MVEFNHLRRMYPLHTDRSKGVLAALEFFGIEYPVQNYQAAWGKLLESYRSLLGEILSAVRQL